MNLGLVDGYTDSSQTLFCHVLRGPIAGFMRTHLGSYKWQAWGDIILQALGTP